MVMVTTTGYIVTIFGPFFSDFQNNDASILKHVMLNNYEDILNWTKEGDIMILDRGFRDSLGVLKALGIDTAMPSFLSQNQQQLDVYDANRSRFITKLRWVVESVNDGSRDSNGLVKPFKIRRYHRFLILLPLSQHLPIVFTFLW